MLFHCGTTTKKTQNNVESEFRAEYQNQFNTQE